MGQINSQRRIQIRRLSLVCASLAFLAAIYCPAGFGQSQPQQSSQPAAPGAAPPAGPNQESSSKKDPIPDSPAESSSKKAPIPDGPADQPKSKGAKPGVLPPEDDPAWDPFHAQQDIDVGEFYLHKGDLDAAITRFEDAIRLRANFAKPRILLAETYEKKGDKSEAVRYYKEYLQVLPSAPDAKKVQQKIEKLSKK
jgi:tetratricopeptide (TPR) repeat protein